MDGIWKYSSHEQTIDDGHGNINNMVDTDMVNRHSGNYNNNNVTYLAKDMNNVNTYTEINYEHQGQDLDSANNNKGSTLYNNYKKPKEADLKMIKLETSSSSKIETNFQNNENNFNEEAPEIPTHLLSIRFLSVCKYFLVYF